MLRRGAANWTHEIQIPCALNIDDPDIFETIQEAAAVAKPILKDAQFLFRLVDGREEGSCTAPHQSRGSTRPERSIRRDSDVR